RLFGLTGASAVMHLLPRLKNYACAEKSSRSVSPAAFCNIYRVIALSLDEVEDHFLRVIADDFIDRHAFFDQHQSRDACYAESGGKLSFLIDVYLADLDRSVLFLCHFFQNGRDHLARAAPC